MEEEKQLEGTRTGGHGDMGGKETVQRCKSELCSCAKVSAAKPRGGTWAS